MDMAALEVTELIFAQVSNEEGFVSFDSFADWYTEGGHLVIPWLELLDLGKHSLVSFVVVGVVLPLYQCYRCTCSVIIVSVLSLLYIHVLFIVAIYQSLVLTFLLLTFLLKKNGFKAVIVRLWQNRHGPPSPTVQPKLKKEDSSSSSSSSNPC